MHSPIKLLVSDTRKQLWKLGFSLLERKADLLTGIPDGFMIVTKDTRLPVLGRDFELKLEDCQAWMRRYIVGHDRLLQMLPASLTTVTTSCAAVAAVFSMTAPAITSKPAASATSRRAGQQNSSLVGKHQTATAPVRITCRAARGRRPARSL